MDKRLGRIRLAAWPAPDVWSAPTALVLYAVEPRSSVTVAVDTAGLKPGSIAGLLLAGEPWMWLGVSRTPEGQALVRLDAQGGEMCPLDRRCLRVWLQALCDFGRRTAAFRFSADGRSYAEIGKATAIGKRGVALSSIRCSLFCCTTDRQAAGGHADFDTFVVNSYPAPLGHPPS